MPTATVTPTGLRCAVCAHTLVDSAQPLSGEQKLDAVIAHYYGTHVPTQRAAAD